MRLAGGMGVRMNHEINETHEKEQGRVVLKMMDKKLLKLAQEAVTQYHYLHRPVDARCSVEGYVAAVQADEGPDYRFAGALLVGRPEATRCGAWYGGVEDVRTGRCEVTRWQVLNLARVFFNPEFQPGGEWHNPERCLGFVDRRGVFRSTLVSMAIGMLAQRVGVEYLLRRPPCFLDEPYEVRWLMSYCDTRIHKGTIYKAAGFELYRTNDEGIQTWRLRLPELSKDQDNQVREAARVSNRSQAYRAKRDQLRLEL